VRSSRIILAILLSVATAAANAVDASLAEAVRRQDTGSARVLLARHSDVNATLADGSTALFWAARWDDAALVDQLLGAGASPSIANRYGISPLFEACENGDHAIIEDLLKAGADPNSAQPQGETALMTAARTGDVDSVKALIDHGARVNAVENWRGQSALMWAAAEQHPEVVKLLIDRGADVNATSRVFDYSRIKIKQGSVPMNYPRGGFTALLFAARQGDLASGRALWNARANVNLGDPDGTAPLIEAIINSHFDFAAFLLDHGADPNARDSRGRSPLYAAVDMHTLDTSTRPNQRPGDKLDSLQIVTALLEHGANPNVQLTAPIPPRGPLDDLDASMGAGATPFLRAAKADDVEVMRLLLDKGADPRIATKAHETALMAAAGVGWRDGKSHGSEPDAIEAIKLCLDLGLDINVANDSGKTALHGAAQRGAETVISFLISRGADTNAKDETGGTALGSGTVQAFSAQLSALGTSTGGFAPSVPASFNCAACTGPVTVLSSAPWVVFTSITDGSVAFNAFSNPSSSPRTAVIQAKVGRNRAFLTINQAASTAPLLYREVAFLNQQVLGREPDASGLAFSVGNSPSTLGRLAADFLDSREGQEIDFQAMAIYQAIIGSAPGYSTYLTALQALRRGTSAESQFREILRGSPCSLSPQATVECIYRNLLNRAPESLELSAGIAMQPFALFTSLFAGPEFQSQGELTADHTNALYPRMLYYLILERAPSESELAHWLNVANSGGPGSYYNQIPSIVGPSSTQLSILGNGESTGLTGSPEFLARFQ
jgi:uncharacterized protein